MAEQTTSSSVNARLKNVLERLSINLNCLQGLEEAIGGVLPMPTKQASVGVVQQENPNIMVLLTMLEKVQEQTDVTVKRLVGVIG